MHSGTILFHTIKILSMDVYVGVTEMLTLRFRRHMQSYHQRKLDHNSNR